MNCEEIPTIPFPAIHTFTKASGPVEGYEIVHERVCNDTAEIITVRAFDKDGNLGPDSLPSEIFYVPETGLNLGLLLGIIFLLWRKNKR